MAHSSKQVFTNFHLEDLYNQVETEMKLDMSSACMPAMSLAELAALKPGLEEKILEIVMNTKLSYSSQFGSDRAIEAIAKLYAMGYEPSAMNCLLTSGASEAIFLIMSTMFEAGDSIIVQQPIYQSLYQVAADRGVKIINWNLSRRNQNWNLNELESLIKQNPECKALVINNPNNPTGLGFTETELNQISKLLEDRILISDEVFLFVSNLSSAINYHHNSFVISDLSKSFNLPGLRLGWIINQDSEVIEKCSSFKNYLSLRTNTLSEALSPMVLELAPELNRRNKELIRKNIDSIYSLEQEIFDLNQIDRNKIKGLCIFPFIKNPELIEKVWQEKQIFFAKGENFGQNWGNHLRIGLGLKHDLYYNINTDKIHALNSK